MDAKQIFAARLPRRPYCTDDLEAGLSIRPAQTALQRRHIQPNPPLAVGWLTFDLDHPQAALAWEAANLPPPTISVINPENRHAHLLYGLVTPISTSDAARAAPIRYAAAIQAAYLARLKADAGYVGLIAKNPFHLYWLVDWVHKLYELAELAEYVALPKCIPAREAAGLGRNCTLFDELRSWAYQWVRVYKRNGATLPEWLSATLAQAEKLNAFPVPLAFSEVRVTAQSVARWTWRHFNETAFSALQSARGQRGGRPKTTTAHGEPWKQVGVSRATYYRRLKSGLLVPE